MGQVSSLLGEYGPAFGQALLLTWKLTLVSKIATDSAVGMAAFAVAAAMYVATGLLIAWAGATLEKKVRILR